MWYNTGMTLSTRRGQAALEYVLALASLLVVCGILFALVGTVRTVAVRNERLVSSEYP